MPAAALEIDSPLSLFGKPLLEELDHAFSDKWWSHYNGLVAKRETETIEPDELRELVALTDTLEEFGLWRARCITKVAQRLGLTLREVMDAVGLKPRPLV